MAKIILVTSFFNFSGPNNVLRNLVKGLISGNEDFKVCSLRKRGDPQFIKTLNLDEQSCLEPKGNSFLHLLNTIRKNQPAVVHSSGIRADIFTFILGFFFSFKHISTIHNIPNEDYRYRYGKIISFFMVLFHGVIFSSQRTKKVCVSNNVKNNLVNNLNGKNCSVVYNGVDEGLYKEAAEKSPGGRKKLVFCGHLSFLKNPLELAEVASEFPDSDFIYLGSGPLFDKLNTYGTNVITLGRVNNVNEILSEADCFVMPSKTEGMPMAFVEALFSNIPVVCSNIPIFNEIKGISKSDIYIFELGSKESLVNSINKALDLDISHNRKFALNYFSYKKMTAGYLSEYGNFKKK